MMDTGVTGVSAACAVVQIKGLWISLKQNRTVGKGSKVRRVTFQ